MQEAIQMEIEKKYVAAAECYEREIETKFSEAGSDTFINLAFLYWSFAFEKFEFSKPNGISDYWVDVGGNRFLKIIELGMTKFPENAELQLWKKYFLYVGLGEDFFSETECLNIIKRQKSDIPNVCYFFLYSFNVKKYKPKMIVLNEEIERLPTAKNLYIKGILSSNVWSF